MKVGDALSLGILGLCCGGTFIGLSLTSVAKKTGQTGPPPKPDFPWLQSGDKQFEAKLKQMDIGGGAAAAATAAASSSAAAGPGGAAVGASSTSGGGGDKGTR